MGRAAKELNDARSSNLTVKVGFRKRGVGDARSNNAGHQSTPRIPKPGTQSQGVDRKPSPGKASTSVMNLSRKPSPGNVRG